MDELMKFLDPSTLPLYFLGFLTFLTTIIDDWLNTKKKMKSYKWYIQEFIYTVISIALGISCCFALDTSLSICWVVSIMMGLIGSTFIRKIQKNKNSICDELIDSAKNKAKKKLED